MLWGFLNGELLRSALLAPERPLMRWLVDAIERGEVGALHGDRVWGTADDFCELNDGPVGVVVLSAGDENVAIGCGEKLVSGPVCHD